MNYSLSQEVGGRGQESYQNVKSGLAPSQPYTNVDFTDVSQRARDEEEEGMYMNVNPAQKPPKRRQPKQPVVAPPVAQGQAQQLRHLNGGSVQSDSGGFYQNVGSVGKKWDHR